jgi:large subunit ribosomal protein L10
MAHVAQWKKTNVKDSIKRMKSQPVVGLVDISRIPAKQFQQIRKRLRGKVDIVVTKNNLLKIALAEAAKDKKGIEQLQEFIDGQMALVTTTMNAFKLCKELESTKTKMPAKGGETSEEEITVKEGDTEFKPGPVIGDFQKAGLPAVIERGKIVIKKDCTLVKKGEKISREVANALTKLEIFPMTVGLDLMGAYEEGFVFARDSLLIDEVAQFEEIVKASVMAHSLAINIQYPTAQTIPVLISNAHQDAMSLGINAKIIDEETVEHLLRLAHSQGLQLQSKVGTNEGR